jgi:integrase/recombinase XerD
MALLRAGTDITVIALWLGHERAETAQIYIKPRVLHQAGEKPQVSWSAQAPNGFRSPMADAC